MEPVRNEEATSPVSSAPESYTPAVTGRAPPDEPSVRSTDSLYVPRARRKRTRLRVLAPLRIRDFALLWAGMTISLLGDGVYFVAIAWQVLQISNAPTALSAVGVAWLLPQVVFLLVGGVVSDRWDRRKVMIAADIVRGLAIGFIGVLALADVLQLWHVIVLVAIYGAADAFFMPAFGAIVPDIVPRELLVEANSLDQFVRPLGLRLIGPAIGGFLVAAFGAGEAFLLNAATFFVSAVCVTLIRPRPLDRTRSTPSMLQEVKEGLSFVRAHTWLWGTLCASAVGLLCFIGPLQVLVPYIVKRNLGGDAADYGLILAVGGIGAILASLAIGQRGLPKRHVSFMYITFAVGTFAVAYYAVVETAWQAMVAHLLMGACFTAGMVVWGTLMHRHVPAELLGRVSSLDWLVSTSLAPISYAIVGPLAVAFGTEATIAVAGALGGFVVLAFLLLPGIRDLERTGAHGTS